MLRSAAVAVLLLLPLASAGPAPVVGFFADGESGPVGDGVIAADWPDSEDGKVRAIVPDLLGQPLVVFAAEDAPGTHLQGPIFAGIWPDAGAAKDSYIHMVVTVDGDMVAESTALVDIDPANAPDPTALVPPDPTDPEGTVYYELAQLMPLLLQPPTLVDMGAIDVEVPEGADVVVSMSLVGPDGAPPTGASVLLKYDSTLSPSFVYLPWWSADPEVQSPQLEDIEAAQPEDPEPAPVMAPDDDAAPAGSPAGEDSPGIGVVAVLGLLTIAFWARRR